MTQLVTVQTDFRDLEEMAHGLAGRVHGTHVILPAGDAVDEGEWAQFEITLFDGRAGLAGLGRCVTVVDNGAEREPHQRFDVVFDSLQFDTHEQRVFEHILSVHGVGGQELEQVADADAESLPAPVPEDTGSYVDVSAEFMGSSRPANAVVASAAELDDADEGENTIIAGVDELSVVSASSVPPRSPTSTREFDSAAMAASMRSNGGYGNAAVAHQVLEHALHDEALEEPVSGERIAPARGVNGSLFAYTNGIPFPQKPPRPDLDPSLRVTPAPRPGGGGGH